MSKIEESIDKLKKALNSGSYSSPLIEGSPLNIKDLSGQSRKYLTEKSVKDLGVKTTTITRKMDDGTLYNTIYFRAVVRIGNEEKAIKEIAVAVNQLTMENKIVGCLSDFSSVELPKVPLKAPPSVVFCFVMVNSKYIPDIESRFGNIIASEGSIGSNIIEDLEIELKDGEFLAEIRVSSSVAQMANADDLLQKEIDLYLATLPQGTVVLEKNQCATRAFQCPTK
jgi:hypothetical protein